MLFLFRRIPDHCGAMDEFPGLLSGRPGNLLYGYQPLVAF
jgi:hypothetical protein